MINLPTITYYVENTSGSRYEYTSKNVSSGSSYKIIGPELNGSEAKDETARDIIRYKVSWGTNLMSLYDKIEKESSEFTKEVDYWFDLNSGSTYKPGSTYTINGDLSLVARFRKYEVTSDDLRAPDLNSIKIDDSEIQHSIGNNFSGDSFHFLGWCYVVNQDDYYLKEGDNVNIIGNGVVLGARFLVKVEFTTNNVRRMKQESIFEYSGEYIDGVKFSNNESGGSLENEFIFYPGEKSYFATTKYHNYEDVGRRDVDNFNYEEGYVKVYLDNSKKSVNDVSGIKVFVSPQSFVSIPPNVCYVKGFSHVAWLSENLSSNPLDDLGNPRAVRYVVTFNGDNRKSKSLGSGPSVIRPIMEKITYKVTFDLNGGSINGDQRNIVKSADEDNKVVSLPKNPVKEGCTFLGWFWENGRIDKDCKEIVVDSSKTITALFSKSNVWRNKSGWHRTTDNKFS